MRIGGSVGGMMDCEMAADQVGWLRLTGFFCEGTRENDNDVVIEVDEPDIKEEGSLISFC